MIAFFCVPIPMLLSVYRPQIHLEMTYKQDQTEKRKGIRTKSGFWFYIPIVSESEHFPNI